MRLSASPEGRRVPGRRPKCSARSPLGHRFRYPSPSMDLERSQPDDLSVRLKWPQPGAHEDLPISDESRQDRASAPGVANGERPPSQPPRTGEPPASTGAPTGARTNGLEPEPVRTGSPDIHAALASITLRIDTLANTTTMLCNLVSDQLSRSIAQAARDRDQLSEELLEGLGRFGQQVQTGVLQEIAGLADHIAAVGAQVGQIGANAEETITRTRHEILADIERSGGDGDELRSAMDRLTQTVSGLRASQERHGAELLDKLDEVVHALPQAAGGSGELIARIEQVSEQVEALRRRIPLRARPPAAALDQATVAALADAIAAGLATRSDIRPAPVQTNPAATKMARPLRSASRPAAPSGSAGARAPRRGQGR
jgi:hypothetical protein